MLAFSYSYDYVNDIKSALINELIENNGDLKSLKYIKGTSNPLYDYINV